MLSTGYMTTDTDPHGAYDVVQYLETDEELQGETLWKKKEELAEEEGEREGIASRRRTCGQRRHRGGPKVRYVSRLPSTGVSLVEEEDRSAIERTLERLPYYRVK